jgi:hypothetical protein
MLLMTERCGSADPHGRLESITQGSRTATRAYRPLLRPDGETLAFDYDAAVYDAAVTLGYDDDGLLTSAGPLTPRFLQRPQPASRIRCFAARWR